MANPLASKPGEPFGFFYVFDMDRTVWNAYPIHPNGAIMLSRLSSVGAVLTPGLLIGLHLRTQTSIQQAARVLLENLRYHYQRYPKGPWVIEFGSALGWVILRKYFYVTFSGREMKVNSVDAKDLASAKKLIQASEPMRMMQLGLWSPDVQPGMQH